MSITITGSNVTYGPSIVTDGLIVSADVYNDAYKEDTPLTYDYSVWEEGQTGNISPFTDYGNASQNRRIIATDPWGDDNVIWKMCSGDTYDDTYPSQGGIYGDYVAVDTTKLYRMSYWENRFFNGPDETYGRYYFGCNGNNGGIGNLGSGTANTNPYFWNIAYNGLPINTWFLMVGHIHPHTNTSTAEHVDSGRWNVDGTKIGNVTTDYQFRIENTTARPRTLALYRGYDTDTVHHSLYPRFDLCDGFEPSLDDLLHGRHEQIRDNISNNRIGVNLGVFTGNTFFFNNNYKSVINFGDIEDISDSFSVSVWINSNNFSSTYTPIISRDGVTTGNFSFGFNNSGNIVIRQYNSESYTRGTCSVDTWYYVTVSVSNKVGTLYINGVQQSTTFTFTSSFNDTGDIKMANSYDSGTSYLNAYIQLPKVYNRALSNDEDIKNYNATKTRFGL